MSDRFIAVDVETANADLASICQIGIVAFDKGEITDSWMSLVNPEDEFDPVNISIHGIDEDRVSTAPTFPLIHGHLSKALTGRIVASHMAFDKVALTRAHERYKLPGIDCEWLDTARVARRAWEQFSQRGYGLHNVASWCGIEFNHHDAEEDARAAGMVLLRAIADTGLNLREWLTQLQQRTIAAPTTRTGAPDGPLAGNVVVFTGALSLPRREAADLAATAGCTVSGTVGKKTTLLVVGDQDVRKLAGHKRSRKHRDAESLIQAGHSIRILCERDFRQLVAVPPATPRMDAHRNTNQDG